MSNNINRHIFTNKQMDVVLNNDPEVVALLLKLNDVYSQYTPLFLYYLGYPLDVITSFSFTADLSLSGLVTDEGQSVCAVHRDPPAPLPARIGGPTIHSRSEAGGWVPTCRGGKLVLVDGLFSLEYSPTDLVLLDGAFYHAVSMLQGMKAQFKGQCTAQHAEFRRFSTVSFNTWNRPYKLPADPTFLFDAQWDEAWRSKLPMATG